MALKQDDTVYRALEEDESLESDADPEENDDELDDHEEDINSPSTSSPAATSSVFFTPPTPANTLAAAAASEVTVAIPLTTIAAIPMDSDPERPRMTTETAQKPQVDESRRLFQRLWTDEDEIQLLRGFLDHTTTHRSSYHHDTGPFYEQVKSRLQLDFNKNQLVEKLRRLKRKFRNAMNKINSGKEIAFKSPHDQATFEISRKIWSDTGKIIGFEDNVLDDEETNNNSNLNLSLTPCSNPKIEVKVEEAIQRKAGNGSGSSCKSRKRSRLKSGRIEEEKYVPSDGFAENITDPNEHVGGGDCGANLAGVIEETVKSCLSPLLKEVMNGTNAAGMIMGGTTYGGANQGMGLWSPTLILPPLPQFGFAGIMGLGGGGGRGGGGGSVGVGVGEVVNESWRKQQISELEVYLRRLELVQDQISAALEELRSMGVRGSGGGGGW